MKRVRCPKCDNYITFDDRNYEAGQILVFDCQQCRKQFKIRIKTPAEQAGETTDQQKEAIARLVVVENVFHFKQEFPLYVGRNRIGRYVKGGQLEVPIETADPSIDTLHCIIQAEHSNNGYRFILRDAPSHTGTFYMNEILKNQDRIRLQDGDIITIGAATLILYTDNEKQ